MTAAYDVMAPFHPSLEERDAALATLRRDDAVHWDPENEWWLLTRHADVREVSKRPDLFSSEPKGPWHVFEYHFSMQAMDGARHIRHRNVVSRAFTPRLVRQMEERALRYTDEAIDAVIDKRQAEFVGDLASPVPMRIIADMLGVADGDLDQFRQWSDALVLAGGGHAENDAVAEMATMMADFMGYLSEQVERRRKRPEDDVLSRIIEAADAGVIDDGETIHRLEGDEVRDFALFLLVAGNETTRNAISQGMSTLFQEPDERARLVADPTLWPTATEEILRWTSPVRAMRRVALRDTTLGDQPIRAGESVVMVYAAANRDPDVFDDPHAFRVDRTAGEHLAFGFGPHHCLGANLARMEIRTVLARILERLPGIHLADGAEAVPTPSALIDGLDALPVQW